MKPVEWKTYRTRFLVKAKQLTSSLSFTDHLGRQHCGRKGDYLVESFDGVLSIAPRQIFEDVYVPMMLDDDSNENAVDDTRIEARTSDGLRSGRLRVEPLSIATVESKAHPPRVRDTMPRHEAPSRTSRKFPQPVRDRRSASRLGLM